MGFRAMLTMAALVAMAVPAQAQGKRGPDKVPPGHMPPPGMCRVWVDGVPPGRQPPPTDCATARRQAGYDARVIYGDGSEARYSRRDAEIRRERTTRRTEEISQRKDRRDGISRRTERRDDDDMTFADRYRIMRREAERREAERREAERRDGDDRWKDDGEYENRKGRR